MRCKNFVLRCVQCRWRRRAKRTRALKRKRRSTCLTPTARVSVNDERVNLCGVVAAVDSDATFNKQCLGARGRAEQSGSSRLRRIRCIYLCAFTFAECLPDENDIVRHHRRFGTWCSTESHGTQRARRRDTKNDLAGVYSRRRIILLSALFSPVPAIAVVTVLVGTSLCCYPLKKTVGKRMT